MPAKILQFPTNYKPTIEEGKKTVWDLYLSVGKLPFKVLDIYTANEYLIYDIYLPNNSTDLIIEKCFLAELYPNRAPYKVLINFDDDHYILI